jgi:hypothetical protein
MSSSRDHAPSTSNRRFAPTIEPSADLCCDLCGAPMAPREFSQAVRDVSGLDICTLCLEDTLHASTFDAGPTLALVGRGGGRS